MSYDLYVEKPSGDAFTQLHLLALEQDPLRSYLQLAHGRLDQRKKFQRGAYNNLIACELDRIHSLKLQPPGTPDLQKLPIGTWSLQFTFTLAKPWMSKDGDPFYVAESVNPVRKDKVFKVPMMSAAGWKGLLRWTMMHMRLALRRGQLSPDDFAAERLAQTLLFGDEKGEEPGQVKDFADYLDERGGKEARQLYEQKTREYFHLEEKEAMPHHAGRLMFYPTFFDLIDVEVINPHKRETKAGTHPIYLECVPAGAQGTFSLLYVSFDFIGQEENAISEWAQADLKRVAETVSAMLLTYGFSAKRTSGYGTAQDRIENGTVRTRTDSKPLSHLSKLAQEVVNVTF
jgi:CRISPR-associated protein Cmr2